MKLKEIDEIVLLLPKGYKIDSTTFSFFRLKCFTKFILLNYPPIRVDLCAQAEKDSVQRSIIIDVYSTVEKESSD